MYLLAADTDSNILYIFLTVAAIILFETFPIRHYLRNREASQWTGRTDGEVVGLRYQKLYSRYRCQFIYREIPTVSYLVNGTVYWEEYVWGRRKRGTYVYGQKILVKYDEKDPENFLIVGDDIFKDWKKDAAVGAAVLLVGSSACVHFAWEHYLYTHEFLFEEATYVDVADSFEDFNPHRVHFGKKTIEEMDVAINAVLDHYGQLREKAGEVKNEEKRKEYFSRLDEAMVKASEVLRDYYADYISDFLKNCNAEEEAEEMCRALEDLFLKKAGIREPSGEEEPAFSLDDLKFFGQLAGQLYDTAYDKMYREPEEVIGLHLALTEIKIHKAAEVYDLGIPMRNIIFSLIPDYWSYYVDGIDSGASTPLKQEVVWRVYGSLMREYADTGNFEESMWNAWRSAQLIMNSRLKRDENLWNTDRYSHMGKEFCGYRIGLGLYLWKSGIDMHDRKHCWYPETFLSSWRLYLKDLDVNKFIVWD